jgi:uncharacterized protein
MTIESFFQSIFLPFSQYWHPPILFLVGMSVSFINSIAGGGSALSLPILIFMGVPPTIANGTNRISVFFGNLSSASSLHKNGQLNGTVFKTLSPWIIFGAIAGSLVGVQINDKAFRIALALTLVWIVIASQIKSPSNTTPHATPAQWKSNLGALGIGFYGGFIQVGVGFILMFFLKWSTQTGFVKINALKGAFATVFVGISAVIFAYNGKVNWPYALILAMGGIMGGILGSKVQVRKGDAFIQKAVSITSLGMAAKLLYDSFF